MAADIALSAYAKALVEPRRVTHSMGLLHLPPYRKTLPANPWQRPTTSMPGKPDMQQKSVKTCENPKIRISNNGKSNPENKAGWAPSTLWVTFAFIILFNSYTCTTGTEVKNSHKI